jgi:Xaa-Pro aminopeptidase
MLTKEGCAIRRRTLQERFETHDLLIISHPRHIFYLSGFHPQPTELAGSWLNFLLVDREGQARLLADNWISAAARAAHVDIVEIWPWYDFSGPAEERNVAGIEALSRLLEEAYPNPGRVAVERAHLPLAALEALGSDQIDDLGPALQAMRRAKYEDELSCIRRAIQATEAGHLAARRAIRPGMTEIEVYAEVYAAIAKAAGQPIEMLGDFAAGRRSASGGGPPTTNVLREGDLMILDCFPIVGGYRADITNTLCVGKPTQKQRDHLAMLQAAMQSAEAMLRPGVTGAEVYSACRGPIADAGLGEAFVHHAGHGLGLEHPERPFLVASSTQELRVGDVVTLEPGAYLPGWGGARIEHDYLITEDGFERLSNHQIGL